MNYEKVNLIWKRYTDSEIRGLYREAKNKRQQINILADLNCCSVQEIKGIIGLPKEKGKTLPSSRDYIVNL